MAKRMAESGLSLRRAENNRTRHETFNLVVDVARPVSAP